MKQELFVDLPSIKKFNQRITFYMTVGLMVLQVILLTISETNKGFSLLVFLVAIFSLIGIWTSYFKKVKLYKNQPYIVLDDFGIKVFNRHKTEYAKWQDVQAIHLYFRTSINNYYFIQADTYIRLDNSLINLDMIKLLKKTAQNYTIPKFIP